MNNGRHAFRGLHQIGQEGIFQKCRDRAFHFQVAGNDRLVVIGKAHQNLSDLFLQFGIGAGKAENGHDFAGRNDIESGLPGDAVGGAAQTDDDIPKRPVVHVHDAAPGDFARIDIQGIAVKDGIVDDGGKQIVGAFHCRKVIGEMEIDVIHRMNAGKSAAGGAAFDAENGPQRRFSQGRDGGFADFSQGLGKPDGYGGFSFTGRRGGHGRHENQR